MTLAILLADHHLRESLHQVAARITLSLYWSAQMGLLHYLFFVLTTSNMTSSLPVFRIDCQKFDFIFTCFSYWPPKNDFFITWPLFRVTEAWKVIMWVVSPWRRVKRQFLISAPSYTQTTRHKTSWKARRMKNLREIVTTKSIYLIVKYTESCNVCTIFL